MVSESDIDTEKDRDKIPLQSSLTARQELLISAVFIGLLIGFAFGFVSIHLLVALGAVNILRVELPKIARTGVSGYLAHYNFRKPSLKHIGVLVVGIIGYYALLILFGVVLSYVSVQPANHAISEGFTGSSTPAYYVAGYVALFFLLFAPAEEMVFRHYLTRSVSGPRIRRIVSANIVFALFHIPIYLVTGPTLIGFVAVLFLLFVMGCFFAVLYETTDNLLVPTLAHGTVNSVAVVFLFLL